jgi:hypothetical protein
MCSVEAIALTLAAVGHYMPLTIIALYTPWFMHVMSVDSTLVTASLNSLLPFALHLLVAYMCAFAALRIPRMSETRRTRIFAVGAFGGALGATCTAIVCLLVGGYSDSARRVLVACWILVAMSLGVCVRAIALAQRVRAGSNSVSLHRALCTMAHQHSHVLVLAMGIAFSLALTFASVLFAALNSWLLTQFVLALTLAGSLAIYVLGVRADRAKWTTNKPMGAGARALTHTHLAVEHTLSGSANNLDNLSLEAGILEMHIIGEGGKTLS